nr:MAG TPA: hypothetical protein [Caudoviricetes sp.]
MYKPRYGIKNFKWVLYCISTHFCIIIKIYFKLI